MKALSVCQPWAWAIVTGLKTIENRTWKTTYRGPLLIHASKSRNHIFRLADVPEAAGIELDFGAIVGQVNLVDCVPLAKVVGQRFAEGPWCWIVQDSRSLEPVPFVGKAGLFGVPDMLSDQFVYRDTAH